MKHIADILPPAYRRPEQQATPEEIYERFQAKIDRAFRERLDPVAYDILHASLDEGDEKAERAWKRMGDIVRGK